MKILFSFFLSFITLFAIEFPEFFNKQNCDQIIDKTVFSICYDYKHKGARYVAYELDGALVNQGNIKKRERFYTEKTLPKKYRSHTKDYTNSGYDRGHLANDASFDYDEKVLRKTYSMANIVPQAPIVNRKLWIKAEEYERMIAVKLGKVVVINGVVYDVNPIKIGQNQISVPSGFWKMLRNKEQNFERCFYYVNDIDAQVKGDKLKEHVVECSKLFHSSHLSRDGMHTRANKIFIHHTSGEV